MFNICKAKSNSIKHTIHSLDCQTIRLNGIWQSLDEFFACFSAYSIERCEERLLWGAFTLGKQHIQVTHQDGFKSKMGSIITMGSEHFSQKAFALRVSNIPILMGHERPNDKVRPYSTPSPWFSFRLLGFPTVPYRSLESWLETQDTLEGDRTCQTSCAAARPGWAQNPRAKNFMDALSCHKLPWQERRLIPVKGTGHAEITRFKKMPACQDKQPLVLSF